MGLIPAMQAGKKKPAESDPGGLVDVVGECYAASSSRGAFAILL
jgi:hypothetical protein